MSQKIGVEDTLGQVKQYLTEKGYEVKSLRDNPKSYDAIVVSGQDEDFMGIQDTMTKVPVIDARGLTSEQVYDRLKMSLDKK
ncbi:MAG: YkuS family protein [Bacillota bacterium]|nr:YkuS family protein [Bacillota bacterium]